MIPLDVFGSESVAADLLQQVRWRDGVTCPRCRSDRTVKNGSYREFQRHLCKDATARSTTRLARSSLTRRLHSIGGCSLSTRFSGLTRVFGSYSAKSSLHTKRCIGASSASPARSMRLPSILLARSKSTKYTSQTGRKAASATKSRARVACPHADVDRIAVTSHPCSFSLIAGLKNGT